MTNSNVEQSIISAKTHENSEELSESKKFYNNPRLKNGLTPLHIKTQRTDSNFPSDKMIDQLVNLYDQGNLLSTYSLAKRFSENYPNSFTIWKIFGLSAVQIGKIEESIQAFRKCITLKPNYADGYLNLGFACQNQGLLDEAIKAYKNCISLKPNYPEAYNNLGNALKDKDMLDDAISAYKNCILLKSDNAEAHNNMGIAFKDLGKLDKSIEGFKKAILIRPNYAEAYNNLGLVLKEQGKLQEALVFLKKALYLKPGYIDAYFNIGVILKDQGSLDEAIKIYYNCLSLKQDNAEVLNNLGNAFKEQGKLDDAIKYFEKCILLSPNYIDAYSNMGIVLNEQGNFDEALNTYEKALLINSDYSEAHYNSSFIYNLKGDFEKGLELYEWRLKRKDSKARSPRDHLIWDGVKSISGKKFFVYEEQGLGDMIQFCRYLPLLKEKGAEVTFKVQTKMHDLIQTMDSNIVLVDSDPNDNEIDFESPLMSLPYLFKTNLDTIPSSKSYLFANHDKVISWGNRLTKPTFKIGICWQGSINNIDFGRSFPLSLFEDISKLPNVELISLHKGEGEKQIKDINFDLTTLGNDFDSGENAFIDTAAVMANCDLIITSDTVIAHLAGALGCRTWVVLKKVPEWRWMLDRPDSPWYPNMELYRQEELGNWKYLFETIKKNLVSLLK